jgi:hypothetical protein
MESAQTGHVGRSLPRGVGRGIAVDRISAIAGIVTSSSVDLAKLYTATFDDVATQMRLFYDSIFTNLFCGAASCRSARSACVLAFADPMEEGMLSQLLAQGHCHDCAADYE